MLNYKILKSWRKHKKYAVILSDNTTIHFGDTRFKDFRSHGDKTKQFKYLSRASKIRDKNGRLTINNPKSANYWAARVLWNYKNFNN